MIFVAALSNKETYHGADFERGAQECAQNSVSNTKMIIASRH